MPEQKSVQIKICGITGKEEIRWLNEEDVSYAGFVLYEKSSRYVPIRKVSELFEELNENIKKVAVTVSPDVKLVEQIMDAGFDILQVHGSLTEEVLTAAEIPVWQAVNMTDEGIFEKIAREYTNLSLNRKSPFTQEKKLTGKEKITALLMDAKEFGSGKTFGWDAFLQEEGKKKFWNFRQLLKEENIQFVLAGGLSPDNVSRGIHIFAPDIVDVSSGVEKEPVTGNGKDKEKIQKFVQKVQSVI